MPDCLKRSTKRCRCAWSVRRMRAFGSVINWAGDAHYAARLAQHTAVAIFLLAALAALLWAIGTAAMRLRLVEREHWRTLASAILWPAALAGTPLYLLRRDG